MPPINQQGSRAGLVTALVVFVILFVVSAVFAFQFFGKYKDSDRSLQDLQKKYDMYVVIPSPNPPGTLGEVMAARPETGPDTVLDVAIRQIDTLKKSISGASGTKTMDVSKHATDTIAAAQKQLTDAKVTVTLPPNGGLEDAVKAITAATLAQHAIVVSQQNQLQANVKQLATKDAENVALVTKNDEAMKKQKADDDAALTTAQQDATKNNATMDAMKADNDAASKKAQEDAAQVANDLNTEKQKSGKLEVEVASLKNRLAGRRGDVINPIVRQVDAKIVRVPTNEVCYINIGQGEQVTPGLTFEVYDKAEGVPPIPQNATGDEQLPVGKASIEVTHVGTGISECRIVHLQPGAVISEGDVIENLVYDPHIKFKFFVYGKFDLANNGRPNDADADVIKRLVTQWGAKLTDQINVDTDFVVLGSEPVLPVFNKDELTAENQAKLDAATKAQTEYQDKKTQAEELHIPIMNQNRFLYYVGFYDQAKR